MHLGNNPQAPDQGDDEPLAPIVHMINFKTRRALMCRGESARADAVERGFKAVSINHFLNYVQGAKKGFRSKKGAKRK